MRKLFVSKILFCLLLISHSLLAIETVQDPLERKLSLKKDSEGRTTLLKVFDKTSALIYESHFSYENGDYPTKEEHIVLAKGNPERIFSVERAFDSEGKLTEISQSGSGMTLKKQLDYFPSGQIRKIVKPDGATIEYDYNEEGMLTSLKASDGSIHYIYEYDPQNKTVTAKDLLRGFFQFRKYNEENCLIEESQNGEKSIYFGYEEGSLSHIELTDGSSIDYSYREGKVRSVKRNARKKIDLSKAPSALLDLPAVSYQGDGQIESEEGFVYEHDSLYNRLSENGAPWAVNGINQLVKNQYATYFYDKNGNLKEKEKEEGKISYFYDALDRLIRFEDSNGVAVEYVYDPFFRRSQEIHFEKSDHEWKQTTVYFYLYCGIDEIAKTDADGKLLELRVLDPNEECDTGSILLIELEGRLYRPLADSQGSIRGLVDVETGSLVESYRYTAFGQQRVYDASGEIITSSDTGNPWGYCGKRKDSKSDLIFFGRRYYDLEMARWTTPDPLHLTDSPNSYAFVQNDPIKRADAYGLFSFGKISEGLTSIWDLIKAGSMQIMSQGDLFPKVPDSFEPALEKIGKFIFGNYYTLMGYHRTEKSRVASFGDQHLNEKTRVTFINGILTSDVKLMKHVNMISKAHGGEKIHYLFCPTKGWVSDITRAIDIKVGYYLLNYRSEYPEKLAALWKDQIQELGGPASGGTIIHYAHSLGGTETDRARSLLTPEEQKMIRVVTFGSATFIRDEGFQKVHNLLSANDFISIFEPLGFLRNFASQRRNIHYYGFFGTTGGFPLTDHFLDGPTYRKLIEDWGAKFLQEFNPTLEEV